jgi:molybdopterin-dependent oxidoreductase alpha subunit
MDEFFPISIGGDVAFFNGVLKMLIENDWLDRNFIRDHTNGFEETAKALSQQNWEMLEAQSGTTKQEMLRFAKLYADVSTAVFIWSMGLTQHRFGVENVKSLVNVALARGMIGRANTGLVPIRGHSGVQGAAEVGSVPTEYFAGMPVNEANAKKLSETWGFSVPHNYGLSAPEMIDAAHQQKLNVFYIIGGNFLDTMPEPIYVREALERVPLRIHQDIILNSSMFADPNETVLLFPAQTRYEQKGGGTITSTERRIRFSPEIPGPRIEEARSEWEIIQDLAQHVLPDRKRELLHFDTATDIRNEINQVIPLYEGIASMRKETDSFQYGGARILNDGICPNLPDQRARFSALFPQNEILKPGEFYLTTRRGKQFNSIVYGQGDPLIGSRNRNEIYLSQSDADALGLKEGDTIRLNSDTGQYSGICRIGPLHPRTVQVFWPEANVLIARRIDPASHEPDYNTIVTIQKG